jgi:chromosome segregation ATPase
MNRVLRLLTAVVFLTACLAFAQSPSQSLGDYARAAKKTKNAPASDQKKVYDNDNLPANSSISVVGNAAPSSLQQSSSDQNAQAAAPADQASSTDKKDERKDPELKAGQSQDDRKKALDSWKEKLAAQNEKVSGLAHEAELLQREYTVKSAEFYSNPANMAQHPKGFTKDDSDFKQKIADKQKELEDAKAKLHELQDEARKAGAPAGTAEQN